MRIRPFLSILLTLGALCATAAAQSARLPSTSSDEPPPLFQKQQKVDKSRLRDLKGSVKDESGKPVEGAIIQLKNDQTGDIVDFRTKDDGAYIFYDLNMDNDYELKVTHNGFEGPAEKTLSKYDSRKPATLNFELQHKKAS